MRSYYFKNSGVFPMDKNEAIRKVEEFAKKATRLLKIKKIILFGSYATGTFREDSDIDVAVVVDKIEGDFLDASLNLYRIRREIDSRIEPVLLEAGNDSSGFLAQIIKNGYLIS
jgi:uncharacterized protein